MRNTLDTAKILRRNSTEAERCFWLAVRNRQLTYKFYRQMPVKSYIADFLCPELKLIAEIDGGQHNGNAHDKERTQSLNAAGYKVIRFWNNDVLANTEGVISQMKKEIEAREIEMQQPWISPSPQPSPHKHGEREFKESP